MNKKLLGAIAIISGICLSGMTAFADVFEPATSNGYTYIELPAKKVEIAPKQTTSVAAANVNTTKLAAATTTPVTPVTEIQGRESKNYQNAILELDNAQVEIRTRLLDYKAQYTNADEKYILVKEQRAALKKLVKQTEKRIKSLDRTKEKIRKEML